MSENSNVPVVRKTKTGMAFLNGNKVELVYKFCYVGDVICSGGGMVEAS